MDVRLHAQGLHALAERKNCHVLTLASEQWTVWIATILTAAGMTVVQTVMILLMMMKTI